MLIAKQAENAENQQNFVQQGDYQCQAVATSTNNPALFVNQGVPFEATVSGQEEIMDHSGAYDSVAQQIFSAGTEDNAQQMSQQGIPPAGQVLMEITSANQAVDYSFDYSNVLQGDSFTAQPEQTVPAQSPGQNKQHHATSPVQNTVLTPPVEQPQLPSYSTPQQQYLQSPLEEIQAQQLGSSRASNVLTPPNQFVGNVDPFSSSRQIDTSNQPRKGRLPRNVSDSQLYTMDLSQLGTSFQTSLFPSMESNLPPQLEAPNLVAHLQSIQPRTRLASAPAATQAKRARLPRNMSDSRLSSLANMSRSPTSPPSLPTVQSSDVSNRPLQSTSGSTQQSGRRKSGRFPRVMSDTSLINMGQQQQQVPSVPAATSTLTSQRRRKMSDPQHLISAAVAAMPSQTATFTSATETQLYTTSSSLSSLSNTQFLEQLLSVPASSSARVSTTPQAAESFQSANSSVIGQLLTQQSSPSTVTVQMPARDSSSLGGTQDPALLNQLYQLKHVLQKPTVPTELVNALNTLTNTGGIQAAQHKQDQTQAVQQKTASVRPSLQMKPQNQNAITQALQSLLRAPPNVAIQPAASNKQTTQVNSFSSQSSLQAPVIAPQNIQVPTVTIKHQAQNKPSGSTVNQNVLPPTAVLLTPQGGIQSTGVPAQDTHTEQMNNAPEVVTTPIPQVMNIGHPIQGQRIILPANVNLSTLSLAQLGLSPATFQSVSNQHFKSNQIDLFCVYYCLFLEFIIH